VIEDGSLLITNGIIDSVGPTRRIENLTEAKTAEEINVTGHVVLPGFVDSHTHLIAPPARVVDYALGPGDVPGHGSLASNRTFQATLNHVRATPAGTLEFQAKRLLETIIRHGTTTIEAKTGNALNASGEQKCLRVLANMTDACVSVVPTYFGAHAVPPDFEGGPDAYIDWLCSDQLPKIANRQMAEFADIICDPVSFSIEQTRRFLACCSRLGLARKLHAEQTVRSGSIGMALELGAVSVDGLNRVDVRDAEMLARSRTVATLLPAAVHEGASAGFPPARELIDAGAAVAIASAFQATVASTYNMQAVIALACTYMKMTPEEALSAATINGAHALSRGHRCGSLEFGKDADLLVLGVSDYREIPYHLGCNVVRIAMRKGEVVYREGTVSCISP
jgi:imidazolonepropionase